MAQYQYHFLNPFKHYFNECATTFIIPQRQKSDCRYVIVNCKKAEKIYDNFTFSKSAKKCIK